MTLLHAKYRILGVAAALGATLLTGCDQNNAGGASQATDTPTAGNIRVSVDATFEPILKSHIDTFQKLYPNAHVQASYQPEQAVIKDLLEDRVRAVVVSRQLKPDEQAVFDRLKIVPHTTPIATDGVAIIVHPTNPDSMLTMAQLRSIFTGQVKQWSQIGNKGSKLGDISIVFDQNQSSTARYVQDSVTRGAALTKQIYASESNPKLIDYVAQHPNAIGVIGVNWISDMDDPQVQGFLHKVRVASISASSTPVKASEYLQPYQAYLALKTYPLRRTIYVISREARVGLGTGFASFIAGSKGQLIFQKSGLMPANVQARIVQTNKQ